MHADSKRSIHPQAVPRGFLRLYILSLLSHEPGNGYSIIQTIEESTQGAWRPGAGTIYPLLQSLKTEGFLKKVEPAVKGRSVKYSVTEKGKAELEGKQRAIASLGRREQAMMRFFVDVLPATAFASMVVTRGRDMLDIFREKIVQVPEPDRDALLKEMRVIMENQISWIDSTLQVRVRQPSRAKAQMQA